MSTQRDNNGPLGEAPEERPDRKYHFLRLFFHRKLGKVKKLLKLKSYPQVLWIVLEMASLAPSCQARGRQWWGNFTRWRRDYDNERVGEQ